MTGRCRVVVTGVGAVNAAFVGDAATLASALGGASGPVPSPGLVAAETLAGLVEPAAARRLSRVCQLTTAAARLALTEAGLRAEDGLGMVVGTEFGDLRSTVEFADGYLRGGPPGLSPLLFPNTVMNTMAAAATIATAAREVSLTLNAPGVAGELAVARAAAMVAAGRAPAMLAGGVDELAPAVAATLPRLGAREARGEGSAFLVLEPEPAARARGAHVLGEVLGVAWGALPAAPHGVGRSTTSRAVTAALAAAGMEAGDVGWVYDGESGDAARDAWERAVLAGALRPAAPPQIALGRWLAPHSGLGALRVAAAAWTASRGRLPALGGTPALAPREVPSRGLVHAVARGGTQVCLVIGPPPGRSA